MESAINTNNPQLKILFCNDLMNHEIQQIPNHKLLFRNLKKEIR